jgi:hypothetical protein
MKRFCTKQVRIRIVTVRSSFAQEIIVQSDEDANCATSYLWLSSLRETALKTRTAKSLTAAFLVSSELARGHHFNAKASISIIQGAFQ